MRIMIDSLEMKKNENLHHDKVLFQDELAQERFENYVDFDVRLESNHELLEKTTHFIDK
jgi:hypothetical protein